MYGETKKGKDIEDEIANRGEDFPIDSLACSLMLWGAEYQIERQRVLGIVPVHLPAALCAYSHGVKVMKSCFCLSNVVSFAIVIDRRPQGRYSGV